MERRSLPIIALIAILVAGVHTVHAQDRGEDTLTVTLPEITIDAARATETAASAPFAVSVMARAPEEVAYQPALSLQDVVGHLPGVWINDRGHFAQGERISIRGLGWRSAFGVRGVQVVLDGIPLTLPDGQTFEEIVEPSLIHRAELVRSPSSRFWGNASGGVLFLSTRRAAGEPSLRARALAGSYGARQLFAEAALPLDGHTWQAFVSTVEQEGYREYSEGARTRAGVQGRLSLGGNWTLGMTSALVYQDTENPSSLTREQMDQNPRQARPDFVAAQAQKESIQGQVGLRLRRPVGGGEVSASAYGLIRDLTNPLPFAYVAYLRHSGGGRVAVQQTHGRLSWGVGAEAAVQHDDRQNWNTVDGRRGDDRQLDQVETVTEAAVSGYGRVDLTDRLQVSAGLRGTSVHFQNDDNLLVSDDPALNGDQSGSRTLSAWSPSVGLSYQWGGTLLFTNYSTAFETPTTTELVNRPDATGGFNDTLEPQHTRGVEVGARGGWPAAGFRYELALYRMRIDDALIQVGTNEAGREFYGNVGENLHQGVEVSASWRPVSAVQAQLSYTGNRLAYTNDDLDGNRLPGVPDHRIYVTARGTWSGLWSRLGVEAASGYYVDDQNTETARTDGYAVVDLTLGHEGIAIGGARVQPFVSVENLFDERYVGSVVVNAFGGRYYEPAAGRALHAGVNVGL